MNCGSGKVDNFFILEIFSVEKEGPSILNKRYHMIFLVKNSLASSCFQVASVGNYRNLVTLKRNQNQDSRVIQELILNTVGYFTFSNNQILKNSVILFNIFHFIKVTSITCILKNIMYKNMYTHGKIFLIRTLDSVPSN